MAGKLLTHQLHHVAQKSSTTTFPSRSVTCLTSPKAFSRVHGGHGFAQHRERPTLRLDAYQVVAGARDRVLGLRRAVLVALGPERQDRSSAARMTACCWWRRISMAAIAEARRAG